MCGIVGMSLRDNCGQYRHNVEKIRSLFTEMLVSAQARGSAATGVALVSRTTATSKPEVLILRAPLPAEDFVETEDYKKLMRKLDREALSIIGHTRAVSGNNASAVNNINNHPHVHGSIIGVHNGRVFNDDKLWEKNSGYMQPKGKCDSEVIFALLNRKLEANPQGDTEELLAETLEELSGWYAVAIINAKEPHKIYLAKDGSSDLEIAFWTQPEIGIFASEDDYIEEAFEKCKGQHNYGSLKKYNFGSSQIVTIDSTIRSSNFGSLMVSTRKIKDDSSLRQKLLEEHAEDYATTQGKREA
jgi:glucosamine 6-phosphate synthetase-like amidotransferase/phosphosugar isomerase protein